MKKEKDFSEEMLITVLCVGVAAGIVAGMAILAFAYPMFQSGNWAAWVQAIGSLIALAIVYYGGKRQANAAIQAAAHSHNLAAKARRQSALAVATAACHNMKDCLDAIESAEKDELDLGVRLSLTNALKFQGFVAHSDSLLSSLRRMDAVKLADPAAVRWFLEFVYAYSIVLEQAKICNAGFQEDPAVERILSSYPEGEERASTLMRLDQIRVENLRRALDYAHSRYSEFHSSLDKADRGLASD